MKKVRIILCLVLIPILCFGGCGNPVQNSSGDASGKESSKQNDSSQKEDSKTEESSKVENSSKAEESSKPEESSKVENSSKAEVSSKPEESSVAQESSKAEESSLKEESSQLEESSQAEISSTPEESSPSEAGWAAAYLTAIEELTAEYGEGRVENGCFAGLVLVQLIDFDGDGRDELYCAGAPGENTMVEGYVYSYDGISSQLLASIGVGNSHKSTPLSVHKKKEGITYIMMTDGAQDHLFTIKDGSFIETDEFTKTSWNDESMTPEALQEKIDSYETILYVDYSTPDQYDGPNLLAETQKTIEYLQELAE